jgi:hypothetical protein
MTSKVGLNLIVNWQYPTKHFGFNGFHEHVMSQWDKEY